MSRFATWTVLPRRQRGSGGKAAGHPPEMSPLPGGGPGPRVTGGVQGKPSGSDKYGVEGNARSGEAGQRVAGEGLRGTPGTRFPRDKAFGLKRVVPAEEAEECKRAVQAHGAERG